MKTEIKKYRLEPKEFAVQNKFPITLEFTIEEESIVLRVIPEIDKPELKVEQYFFKNDYCQFTYSTICNNNQEIISGTIQLVNHNSPVGNINEGKSSLIFNVSYGETERRGAKLLGIFPLFGEEDQDVDIQNNVKVSLVNETVIEQELEEQVEEVEPIKEENQEFEASNSDGENETETANPPLKKIVAPARNKKTQPKGKAKPKKK